MNTTSQHQAPIDLIVSIVTYDSSQEELARCIDSVRQAAVVLSKKVPTGQVNITVVNNSPLGELTVECLNQRCLDRLSSQNDDLSILQGHGNVGYGSGQNLAFQSQLGRYHLFMNPDVELDPDSLLVGVTYLEQNPDVGLAGPHVVNKAGIRQFLCKRYPTVFDLFLRGLSPAFIRKCFRLRLARYEMQDLSESASSKDVPITSGCFMLCRSEVISQIGGFDRKFFLYFEDFDLCLRVGEVAKVAYLPAMRIRHFGGGAARKGIRHIGMFLVSAVRFFNKHGWQWVRQR